jgi:cyclopropane-fatty-acyl-phospholipid synthase
MNEETQEAARFAGIRFSNTPQSRTTSTYQRLLLAALDKHIRGARITFVTPAGKVEVGNGPEQAPAEDIVVHVTELDFFRKVLCHGNLGMGEAYMAGDFSVDQGRLPEFLTLLLRNGLDRKLGQDLWFAARYLWVRLLNLASSTAKNVQHHYDVGDDLFDSFLEDPYQVYSCGYAHGWHDDVESLQKNKLGRVCRKLDLTPGQRFLDIGSGNGGLLLHAAVNYGVKATGITNSRSHYARSLANIRRVGLEGQVDVVYGDFSSLRGEYDRVASVGMLEHVPPQEYSAYFRKIANVLRPQGWALIHAIGLNTARSPHDPFIQKYIFPGSDTPKLSVMAKQLEANDLAIIDVENIVRHYAVTTRRWLESFRKNHLRLDPGRYDKTVKRMWDYYLSCGVAAALAGNLAVYQVLFTNDYQAEYRFQRV